MNSDRGRVLWEGVLAGLLGYGVVAVVGLMGDLLSGRPAFFTPALLGGAFFYGLRDPQQVIVQAGPVIAYNGFHLALFLLAGILAAWLTRLSERGPAFWYLGASLGLFVFLHAQGLMLFATERMRPALSAEELWVAGGLGALAMGIFLLAAHPRLREEMAHSDADEAIGRAR